VTTAAVALTLVWPRPVLLVEADPAGGDLLAGYLAGATTSGGGLLGLALTARRGPIDATGVLERSQHLDAAGDRRVLVMPTDRAQARPVAESIDKLAAAITSVAGSDDPRVRRDVLVDLGRLSPETPAAWLASPTHLLLLLEPTLRGASAARSTLASLRERLPDTCRVAAVMTGHGPYGATDIGGALEVSVACTIAHDPGSARVLSGEAPTSRGFDRSPLIRSARSLAAALVATDNPAAARSAEPVRRGPVSVGEPP
jgi:hypothetical protein